jgi:hypothetical protein
MSKHHGRPPRPDAASLRNIEPYWHEVLGEHRVELPKVTLDELLNWIDYLEALVDQKLLRPRKLTAVQQRAVEIEIRSHPLSGAGARRALHRKPLASFTLSTKELADALGNEGVDARTIQRWRNNNAEYQAAVVDGLAKVLNARIDRRRDRSSNPDKK